MHKVSRSQFYEYKRSFQTHGIEWLIDKLHIPASKPKPLPKKAKDRIIKLSLEYPAYGHSLWQDSCRCATKRMRRFSISMLQMR